MVVLVCFRETAVRQMGQLIQTRFITVRTERTIAQVLSMVSIILWPLCEKTTDIPRKPRLKCARVARAHVTLTFYSRWLFSRVNFHIHCTYDLTVTKSIHFP